VHVVDRERPMVLSVPCKAGETHAHIAPWHLQHYHILMLILLLVVATLTLNVNF